MEKRLSDILSAISLNLSKHGFNINKGVSHSKMVFDIVAFNKKFSLSKFGSSQTFFIVSNLHSSTFEDIGKYVSECFNYARKNRLSKMPLGLFSSLWCFGVAIINGLSSDVIKLIETKTPPRHWSSAEFPIVIDLSTLSVYYFQKTPIWGAAYYRGFRNIVEKIIVSAVQSIH